MMWLLRNEPYTRDVECRDGMRSDLYRVIKFLTVSPPVVGFGLENCSAALQAEALVGYSDFEPISFDRRDPLS